MIGLYCVIGVIIFIGCIIALIINYKKSELKLEYIELRKTYLKLKEEYDKEVELFKQLHQQQEQIVNDIQKANEERTIALERAKETKETIDQLIQSEQSRLKSEVKKQKEFNSIEVENDFNQKYQALDLQYKRYYEQTEKQYNLRKNTLDAEIILLQSELNDFRSRQEAIQEAILREKELEEKEQFYSLQISDNDKEDIAVLQNMDLKLHNRDVIPKLIWDLFIRRPAQEMIKRVTGGRDISGIYKITNKNTKEAYIGKTVSISTRWQNHLKTAIGLEAAAKSTLHTRLAADGLWNYTFEILEEVSKEKLSERESFYIDLYGTKKQLNMKEGVKNATQ